MKTIRQQLAGTDRRSIGNAERIVRLVEREPKKFEELIALMADADAVVRMRASDAVEKATIKNHALLLPHKKFLLTTVAVIDQQEVQWHFLELLPRLGLTRRQQKSLAPRLFTLLQKSKSAIVRTYALQALSDFAQRDESLKPTVTRALKVALRSGTPAMKSRARKLLPKLTS